MQNPEIGAIRASEFRQPYSYGQAHGVGARRERPAARHDIVELTEPHRAALRLLRQRVLQNTRLALELSPRAADRFHFARIPEAGVQAFLGRLVSDQNLLASVRRGQWGTSRVDEALESGIVQGTAETLEVLYELEELDAVVWRMISSVLDEYYRKLMGVSPETIRERVWEQL